MQVQNFYSNELMHFDSLVSDYLSKSEKVGPFISAFPSERDLMEMARSMEFPSEKRELLFSVLQEQYQGLNLNQSVEKNVQSFLSDKTFSITTGHQLCLFTGPLYFIYKIVSTIKLARMLNEIAPDKNFVPVYWLASEDHDFAEVNHAFIYNKKIEWFSSQKGAVGDFDTKLISDTISEFISLLGDGTKSAEVEKLLRDSYRQPNLSKATRFLVNELFGRYGLVIIDANSVALKKSFKQVMQEELISSLAYDAMNVSNQRLKLLGYKTQVNPRKINLFYLDKDIRSRIEKVNEVNWKVLDSDIHWNQEELINLLDEHPEQFSPNVILRPLYQESILPNLAYIGGPGELAYWLQLKSVFEVYKVRFPILILRDSVLMLNEKILSRLNKLGINPEQLFLDKQELQKLLFNTDVASLNKEKSEMKALFDVIASKVKGVDATLENSAMAEEQKVLSSLENLEKKMIKAIKLKEDIKIQQLDKVMTELFPEGIMQERHDNYFQHRDQSGDGLIDQLLECFNPLKNQIHFLGK